MLEELEKPKKSKPKKTGKKKKRVNQGQLKKEMEKKRELEEERKQKEKEPVKTIQSLGNAWQTQMMLNKSKIFEIVYNIVYEL